MRNSRLDDLVRACDPQVKATTAQYYDCNPARGNSNFVPHISRTLDTVANTQRWIFTGHIGSGKSSELAHLAEVLKDPKRSGKRFLPITVDVLDYVTPNYVTASVVQLAMVAELAAALRALSPPIHLEDNFLAARFREILSVLQTPMQPDEVEAGLGGIKAKFKAIREAASVRSQINSMLRPQSPQLLRAASKLFETAGERLKNHSVQYGGVPYDGFIFLVDNLDRVTQVPETEAGEKSHKKLFIDEGEQLADLAANIVYTVPLTAARRFGTSFKDVYANEPFVLPMIKVCRRNDSSRYEPGYAALTSLLSQRLGGEPTTAIIDDDALKFLIEYTGGYVREFVAAIQSAALRAEGQTITRQEARQVVADTYATYENGMQRAWVPKIAELMTDPLRRVNLEDDDILDMLREHYILEYRNGFGGEDDEQSDDEAIMANTVWYAPHPLIRRSELVRAHFEALKTAAAAPIEPV